MKKILSIICCALCCIFALNLSGCAYWQNATAIKHNVSFYINNEIWQNIELNKLTELPTPTNPYYDFKGWHNNADEKIDLDDVIYNNVYVLHAKWQIKSDYEVYEVISNSMAPTLSTSDYIIVNMCASEFEVGDIVMYRISSFSSLVTHRIIDIDGDVYTVKGDNSIDSKTINKNQIIGLVCENLGKTLPYDVDFTPNEPKTLITTSEYIDENPDRFELENFVPNQLLDWNISVQNTDNTNLYCVLYIVVMADGEYCGYEPPFLDITRQTPSDDWEFHYMASESALIYTFVYSANMGVMTPDTQSMVFNDGFFKVSKEIGNEFQDVPQVDILYGLKTIQEFAIDNPDLYSDDVEIRNQAILNAVM